MPILGIQRISSFNYDMKLKLQLMIFLFLGSLAIIACEIPVFRFALERWDADLYKLKVFVSKSQEISSFTQAKIDRIVSWSVKSGGNANLSVQIIEKENSELEYELLYPHKSGIIRPVIKGALSEFPEKLLIDSPSRSKISSLILSGKSIVWVVIPGYNQQEAEAFRNVLKTKVSKALDTVKLSEGIIKSESSKKKKLSREELENALNSEIPLELSFDIVEIDRSNPKETVFLKMMLRQNPHLMDYKGPIAFPVFGRGRALDGVVDLNGGDLEKLTLYLSGHCSCTVKEENPGIDLLMNVPWADYVAESQIQFKDVLPPLSGLELKEEKQEAEQLGLENTVKKMSVFEYLFTVLAAVAALIVFFLFFSRAKSH